MLGPRCGTKEYRVGLKFKAAKNMYHWCLDAQATHATKNFVVPRICEKTADIHIHHHHRHATTMTVMLVPRRPASEIDTAWQLHGSMATLITLIFNTIHNGHGFWRRFM